MEVLSPTRGALRRSRARLALALFATAGFGTARAQPAPEYEVKAAFLYNFAKFIEWPADALPDSAAPIVVGVMGHDPFGTALDHVLAGKLVDRHPLQVRRFPATPGAGACHILFVGAADEPLQRILQSLADSPVLTVGESDDFLELGGIVRFVIVDNKVRFEIQHRAAVHARLRLSSKLLRLALAVRAEERR